MEKSKNQQLHCPVCGSANIDSTRVERSIDLSPTEHESVLVFQDTCSQCGESGDFGDRNDSIINEAVHLAEKRSVERMIQFLSAMGITMAHLERVLGLPQRTTMRWKSGEHSAAAVALLRLIRTYPWLLKVAESGFDESYSQRMLLEQTAAILQSALGASSLRANLYHPTISSVAITITVASPSGPIEAFAPTGGAQSQPANTFYLPGELNAIG